MSQDPLGFDAGDSNLYRYVKNAPTNGTDPSGDELRAEDLTAATEMQKWLAGEEGALSKSWPTRWPLSLKVRTDIIKHQEGNTVFYTLVAVDAIERDGALAAALTAPIDNLPKNVTFGTIVRTRAALNALASDNTTFSLVWRSRSTPMSKSFEAKIGDKYLFAQIDHRRPTPLSFEVIRTAARRLKLPTGAIKELEELDAISLDAKGAKGMKAQYGRSPWARKGTITLSEDKTDRLLAGSAGIGGTFSDLYNEVTNAYFDQVILKRGEAKWLLDLVNQAAEDVYVPLLTHPYPRERTYGIGWKTGTVNRELVTMSHREALRVAYHMVDEALSETASSLVYEFQSRKAPNMSALRNNAKPGHATEGSAWSLIPYVRAAETTLPDYMIHSVLWIHQYGSKDPAPEQGQEAVKRALADNWRAFFVR
jgi:hypothetical protein